jgi:hypothetical protein
VAINAECIMRMSVAAIWHNYKAGKCGIALAYNTRKKMRKPSEKALMDAIRAHANNVAQVEIQGEIGSKLAWESATVDAEESEKCIVDMVAALYRSNRKKKNGK